MDPNLDSMIGWTTIAECIPLQMWILSDAESYLCANALHASFHGRSSGSFLSARVVDILGIAPRTDLLISRHRRIFAGREPSCTEEWTPDHAGSPRLLSVTRYPVALASGNRSLLVCTASDITPGFRMEQRLNGLECLQGIMIEMSREGILICHDGKLRLVNDRLCALLGYSREELLGTPLDRIVHPEDRETLTECMGCGSPRGSRWRRCGARLLTSRGEPLLRDIGVSRVVYDDESAVLAVVSDPLRNAAEEEPVDPVPSPGDPADSMRDLRERVVEIARDLNNMLTAAGVNVELAIRNCGRIDSRNLREALAACSRAGALTEQLALAAGGGLEQSLGGQGTAHGGSEAIRVLLVSDDELMRTVSEEMLDSIGCRVEAVSGGAEAVERYSLSAGKSDAFDIVMFESSTGDGDVAETAVLFRERWPEAGLILSVGSGTSRALPAADLSPAVLLRRPYSLERFRKAVLDALEG